MRLTLGCAKLSIIGHVAPPSTILRPKLAMPPCASVVTRMVARCAVSGTDYLVWLASYCRSKRRLTRGMATMQHSKVNLFHSGKAPDDSFSVRLKRRFSVPACDLAPRRAQRRSRLAEGHRGATRSGLDGREHGAKLDQVGTAVDPNPSLGPYDTKKKLTPMTGLPPRRLFFLLDYW